MLKAERANLAKSDFLCTNEPHELRTPMNGILGFAQIMEMYATDEMQLEHISHILKAGKDLLQLINEVLDLARIESGRLSLSIEAVSVADAINNAVEIVMPLYVQRGLELTTEFVGTESLFVSADQQRLSQVILNLLSNAKKYNRKGGPRSRSMPRRCKAGATAHQRHENTGPGIPPQYQPKLFQPFERLGADAGEVTGTGLGLALSKQLIETMGGQIWALKKHCGRRKHILDRTSDHGHPSSFESKINSRPRCRVERSASYDTFTSRTISRTLRSYKQ